MRVIDRIINELKLQSYRQIDLVEHLKDKGVTKHTVTDWKSGKSSTHFILIAEIAAFLNVSTDYLLKGEEYAMQDEAINRNGDYSNFVFFSQLEKLCKLNGTTPSAVTIKLGFSKGSMSHWRKGNTPNGDIVVRFADYFGVSTDYLLKGESHLSQKEKAKMDNEQNNEKKENPSELEKKVTASASVKNEEKITMRFGVNASVENKENINSQFGVRSSVENKENINSQFGVRSSVENEENINSQFGVRSSVENKENINSQFGVRSSVENEEKAQVLLNGEILELVDIFSQLDNEGKSMVKSKAYSERRRMNQEIFEQERSLS